MAACLLKQPSYDKGALRDQVGEVRAAGGELPREAHLITRCSCCFRGLEQTPVESNTTMDALVSPTPGPGVQVVVTLMVIVFIGECSCAVKCTL